MIKPTNYKIFNKVWHKFEEPSQTFVLHGDGKIYLINPDGTLTFMWHLIPVFHTGKDDLYEFDVVETKKGLAVINWFNSKCGFVLKTKSGFLPIDWNHEYKVVGSLLLDTTLMESPQAGFQQRAADRCNEIINGKLIDGSNNRE